MPITRAYASAAQPGNAFLAGKNKIINGDFGINQRAFSSTTSSGVYTFDRFITECGGGTATYSAQTFTAGTAPVTGYESTNFLQIVTSGQTGTSGYALIDQRIENVRTFANQTMTLSFWAKASSGTPKIGTSFIQNFGSGGSASVIVAGGDVTISTSWARYSVTVTIPSVSGKTIGSSSYLRTLLFVSAGTDFGGTYTNIGLQNNTFQIWGIQAEIGSVATAFQTATGTLAGELAACQRYYWRTTASGNATPIAGGMNVSTTAGMYFVQFPVEMRIAPTSVDYSALQVSDYSAYGTDVTTIGFESPGNGPRGTMIRASGGSGFTTNQPSFLRLKTASTSYFGLSSEL